MLAYLRAYFLRWSGGAAKRCWGCIVYCDRQNEEGERKVQFGEKSPRDFGGRMRGGAFFFGKVNSNSRLATSERDVLSAKRVPLSVLS